MGTPTATPSDSSSWKEKPRRPLPDGRPGAPATALDASPRRRARGLRSLEPLAGGPRPRPAGLGGLLRRGAPLLAFLVLLAAPARAELVHRGTRVYTTGDFKEVVIEVTVKNYGNDPVEDVAVVIELEPTPRASAYRTVVELGTLEPGQEKTATYRPGLRATSNFDGTRDSFDVTFGTLSGATLNVRYKVAVAVRAGR